MNRRVLAMVLLAAGACGCSSGTEPEDRPSGPFTTDATTYTAQRASGAAPNIVVYGFTAITRYTNVTAIPIRLPFCAMRGPGPTFGVTDVDQALPNGRIVYASDIFACLSGAEWIVVAPSATRVDTLHVEGTAIVDAATGTVSPWVVEGRFRIFFEAMSCPTPDTCTPAADEQRRSSPFTVRTN
jgi:hypothetical protein